MAAPRVVLFVFAGRRPNLELQLPFVRRILADNPNTEFHIWNLARDNSDDKYLQTITAERTTLFNEYRHKSSPGYEHAYRHYASPEYEGTVFVKLDDDVVFLQTDRFAAFVDAIQAHPTAVLSANTINNGACTPLEPALYERFQQTGIPLLDVHKHPGYAALAHNYFFNHHPQLLAQDVDLVPTDDWLSINAIGYTWQTGRELADLVCTPCEPRNVAGRDLAWLGDEGVVNTMPRIVMRGFLACHLTFGPQKLTETQLQPWRAQYAAISEKYLATAGISPAGGLPPLSPTSRAQTVPQAIHQTRWADASTGNNPAVGRFTP